MKVISVINQKGGVGKTTISIHIADQLSKMGYSVLLIDADPQQSAFDWSNFRPDDVAGFPVVACPSPKIHLNIDSLGKGRDIVVIDGVPRTTELTRSAIMASDLALIPITPSTLDLLASSQTAKLIEEARIYRPADRPLDAVAVINRINRSTKSAGEIREAIAEMTVNEDSDEDTRFPVLKATIGQRILFADSIPAGKTVLDLEPKGPAAEEIRAVTKEILKRLGKIKPAKK